ncbi:MAG TPA: ABC transporter permease [Trueperaceae bacterium]
MLGVRFERRPDPSPLLVFAVSLAAILAALLVTGVLFALQGVDPVAGFATILQRTILDPRGSSEVVRKSIPLLLAGVGIVLALRARFWNIGAEGQILAGAVAASGVALFLPVPPALMVPTMFLAGFIAGAAWGFLPAILKVRLGVNEIITTLMLNYVALYIVRWLINGPWRGDSVTGFSYSDRFPEYAWLPTIGTTRLHWPTLLIGLVLALLLAFVLFRTRLGFEIRMMGESPEAARYAGVDFFWTTIALVCVAAGAAGIAGVGEVAGIHQRLLEPTSISLGYGYTAIIVALLARGNPLATIVTALFMGLVFASGDIMKVSLRLPSQMPSVINGLVLLFLVCSEPLLRYRLVRRGGGPKRRVAKAN